MSDEELDKARAWHATDHDYHLPVTKYDAALIAARLAREGWMPGDDPLLLEAREIVAKVWEDIYPGKIGGPAASARDGQHDGLVSVIATLNALRSREKGS